MPDIMLYLYHKRGMTPGNEEDAAMKSNMEAKRYGRMMGYEITHVVKNHVGCVIGGYTSKQAAEEARDRLNREGWSGVCHVERV